MKGEGGGRKAEGDHLLWQGAEIARCHSERSEESPSGGEILRCAQDDQVSLRLLIDPPAAGPWNMAVDEALLETADRGQCTLRFYQWQQPTLSLGYFQPYEDRWRHEASGSCIAVRRPAAAGRSCMTSKSRTVWQFPPATVWRPIGWGCIVPSTWH